MIHRQMLTLSGWKVCTLVVNARVYQLTNHIVHFSTHRIVEISALSRRVHVSVRMWSECYLWVRPCVSWVCLCVLCEHACVSVYICGCMCL